MRIMATGFRGVREVYVCICIECECMTGRTASRIGNLKVSTVTHKSHAPI